MPADDQIQQWQSFRAYAMDAVRRGWLVRRKDGFRYRSLAKIVRAPMFETAIGWELFETDRPGSCDPLPLTAVRTAWRQTEDMLRVDSAAGKPADQRYEYLAGLSPTLTYYQFTVDDDSIKSAVLKLLSLNIPLRQPSRCAGFDGEAIELIIGGSFTGIAVSWWDAYPPEWHEMGDITILILRSLEEQYHRETSAPISLTPALIW